MSTPDIHSPPHHPAGWLDQRPQDRDRRRSILRRTHSRVARLSCIHSFRTATSHPGLVAMAGATPPAYAAVLHQDLGALKASVVGGVAAVDARVDVVRKVNGRTRSVQGDTALLLACEFGNVALVAMLLEAGADATSSRVQPPPPPPQHSGVPSTDVSQEEHDQHHAGADETPEQGGKKKKRGFSILSINSTKSVRHTARALRVRALYSLILVLEHNL